MMKIDWKKDWVTTLGAIIGSALMIAGFLWPEQVNEVTTEVIITATNEIMVGAGALVNVVMGWIAKDPVLPKISITVK